MASSILRAQKYSVLEAWEWKSASAMVRRNDVRLVLLDFRIERASHCRLAARMKKSQPGLEVILTYQPEDNDAAGRYTGSAGTLCLPKPFTLVELCRTVRSALDGRARSALSSVA